MKGLSLVTIGICLVWPISKTQRRVPDETWLKKAKLIHRPVQGYVREKETALIIGKAVLAETFGKRFLQNSGPYDAKRFGDIWVIYSYFETIDKDGGPNLGGVTTVELSAINGSVLGVTTER